MSAAFAPGSRLLFALVALLLVAGNTAVLTSRPQTVLEIRMTSSVNALAQVFYDTGNGYNERESVSLSTTRPSLSFPLPGKSIRSVRFDPINAAGRVVISQVKVIGRETVELDLAQVKALNQIASLKRLEEGLEVLTLAHANDPSLLLPWNSSLSPRFTRRQVVVRLAAFNAGMAVLAGLGLLIGRRSRRRASRIQRLSARTLAWIDRVASAWSEPGFVRLDRTAVCFYIACLVVFAVLSLGGVHGSSMSYQSRYWGEAAHALVGNAKYIRADEWAQHTPLILNQVLRRDRFAVEPSAAGAHKAALLFNLPVWHFTALFRPQFWPFFVLPSESAFAVYWQFKALLLNVGVFSLLLLLTGSSSVALLGTLWYFFSAYTQWSYSWPTGLPEMTGLAGLIICLLCYLAVGKQSRRLYVAAALCAGCMIDFALACYPPQQIPLVLIAVFVVAWGWLANRRTLWAAEQRGARAGALALCLLSVGVVMGLFVWDAKETLVAAASTVYPGQRSLSGGGVTLAQLASHFLDFSKEDGAVPPGLINVVEGTGYLWLAPLTLVFAGRLGGSGVALWGCAALLSAWMMLPIPAHWGRWLLLDKVWSNRCLAALGLLNVAIVCLYLARRRAPQTGKAISTQSVTGFLGILLVCGTVLVLCNNALGDWFRSRDVLVAAFYVAMLIFFLPRASLTAVGVALLVPLVYFNGLINPIDRGLGAALRSPLAELLKERPELRDGKWMVFSQWGEPPALFTANGLDVVNGFKIVPDLGIMSELDPDGTGREIYNQSAFVLLSPVDSVDRVRFESVRVFVFRVYVSPFHKAFRGVRYAVFEHPYAVGTRGTLLRQVGPYWVYELK